MKKLVIILLFVAINARGMDQMVNQLSVYKLLLLAALCFTSVQATYDDELFRVSQIIKELFRIERIYGNQELTNESLNILLFMEVKSGNDEVGALELLDIGADPTIEYNAGESALSLAWENDSDLYYDMNSWDYYAPEDDRHAP